VYLKVMRASEIVRRFLWRALSRQEDADVQRCFGPCSRLVLEPDLLGEAPPVPDPPIGKERGELAFGCATRFSDT
jgi:hypothetical protein